MESTTRGLLFAIIVALMLLPAKNLRYLKQKSRKQFPAKQKKEQQPLRVLHLLLLQ